ncbi:hypothetical protein VNO78_15425 [Psophocarpus tetragonolobus]|uniref:Uncharacterized protein n=1 Tax=Psophocarpus tetragonolobus TaxID=3891 RepID=A0AAN9SE34_PSOTE
MEGLNESTAILERSYTLCIAKQKHSKWPSALEIDPVLFDFIFPLVLSQWLATFHVYPQTFNLVPSNSLTTSVSVLCNFLTIPSPNNATKSMHLHFHHFSFLQGMAVYALLYATQLRFAMALFGSFSLVSLNSFFLTPGVMVAY